MVFLVILGVQKFVKMSPIKPFKGPIKPFKGPIKPLMELLQRGNVGTPSLHSPKGQCRRTFGEFQEAQDDQFWGFLVLKLPI